MMNFCRVSNKLIDIGKNAWSKFNRRKLKLKNYSTEIPRCNSDYSVDLKNFPPEYVRNFCIIAHVDHGKSTLADRLLEITGTISTTTENEQVLDKLQVERERGITVKAQTASLFYEYKNKMYLLNLVDTPGHVDFSYEVSRSLAACQGVVLLVDANRGIQAQTVANFYLAFTNGQEIVPVLNKIDLKNANPEKVALQMKNIFEIEPESIIKVSAKHGTGIKYLLDAIIERIPPPSSALEKPFSAILFDSWYDRYRGVIAFIAVKNGQIKIGDQITSVLTKKTYQVKQLGIMHPEETLVDSLNAGQIGFVAANIRKTSDAQIGDVFHHKNKDVEDLPKLKPSKPMVFAGIYAVDQSETPQLRNAIEKLTLNDSSVSVVIDSSPALGQGWRLGFLGLLHMDVFNQRLEQEYNAQVVVTAPNVSYKVKIKGAKNIKQYGGEFFTVSNPLQLPDPTIITEYLEPMVNGTIITPDIYLRAVTSICAEHRGVQKSETKIDDAHSMLQFKFPLNEIIINFFDELKRVSSGYASFDYEECGYETTDIVKLTILLNGNEVEELTTIVHKSKAQSAGRRLCQQLKETISQHMFEIAIQATIGAKIIARETVKAFRKDVTAKLYGGDVTRRMKLLKRQSEGKKKMRMIGNIQVPRDVFIQVLKLKSN